MTDPASLAALTAEIVECRRCPRLVAWRERVAAREGPPVPGRDLLGPAGAGVRRPGGADPDRRAGAGGPRRQPDRSGLHRRRLGRLPVGGDARGRASPTDPSRAAPTTASRSSTATSRRPSAARRRRTSPRSRSATPARRSWPASSHSSPGRAWSSRSARSAGTPPSGRSRTWATGSAEAAVRARRRGGRRPVRLHRHLPPEPAEHVHGTAHAGHAPRGAVDGPEGTRPDREGRERLISAKCRPQQRQTWSAGAVAHRIDQTERG